VIDDQVTPDPKHVLHGRGAWLHLKCFELAKQRRAFARAFPAQSKANELQLDELERYNERFIKDLKETRMASKEA
jgi:predicted RNA-binding protein YlxR (DUF448 family)